MSTCTARTARTVAKMRSQMAAVLLLSITIVACAVAAQGCGHAPPNLSPSGASAFHKAQVLHVLDLVRDTAIDGNKLGDSGHPVISTTTTRRVVTWHQSALNVMSAAGTGWQAAIESGLNEVVKDLPAAEGQVLAPYVVMVNTVLSEVSK